MRTVALILIGLIGVLHTYIAWFEIFAWETRGPRVFPGFSPDLFPQTTVLAANQGLYNAFLAAGLFWSIMIRDRLWAGRVAIFFLLCVAVAGVFGALTASPRIILVQTVPAVVALAVLLLSSRNQA